MKNFLKYFAGEEDRFFSKRKSARLSKQVRTKNGLFLRKLEYILGKNHWKFTVINIFDVNRQVAQMNDHLLEQIVVGSKPSNLKYSWGHNDRWHSFTFFDILVKQFRKNIPITTLTERYGVCNFLSVSHSLSTLTDSKSLT